MKGKLIPYGSDVSSGTFKCADCGETITMGSEKSIPPCTKYQLSEHDKEGWYALTGQGDAKDDPQS